jgi:hypothetical protein
MILTGTDPTGHMLAPEPDAHLIVGGVAGEVVVAVLERSIADGKGDIDFERTEAGAAAEGGGLDDSGDVAIGKRGDVAGIGHALRCPLFGPRLRG